MRVLLVAAIALLPGCILAGGPDDLTLVCERKSGSPAHPYPPEALASLTRIEGDLPPERRGEIFRDAADRLLTPGGAPYRAFEARLFEEPPGLWRFEANGSWQEGPQAGADEYRLAYEVDVDGARLSPPRTSVDAPDRLRAAAREIVNRTGDLAGMRAERPDVGSAVWEEPLPSCVRLAYFAQTPPGGPPPTGDPPQPATPHGASESGVTHVWVNLARGQVVYVDEVA